MINEERETERERDRQRERRRRRRKRETGRRGYKTTTVKLHTSCNKGRILIVPAVVNPMSTTDCSLR